MTKIKSILDFNTDVASLTNVGKVREANEDSLGSGKTPNGDVFVVCDGMGGHVGGQIASSIAVESVMEYFGSEGKQNIIIAIKEAIEYANRRIIERWIEQPELKGMGTTIVIVVIQNGDVYIGHVGDSRAYLYTDSKLYRITKDHSYVQGLVDNNVITDEEAETHPRKSELTRALGIKQQVEPTIVNKPLQLKNNDMLLMCSDGLSGLVNDPTIEQAIAKNDSVGNIGKDLIEMALNAGGHDNITLHLLRITNSSYKNTVFEKVQKDNTLIETTLTDINEDETSFFKKLLKNKLLLIIIASLVTGIIIAATWFFVFNGDDVNKDDIKNNNIENSGDDKAGAKEDDTKVKDDKKIREDSKSLIERNVEKENPKNTTNDKKETKEKLNKIKKQS